MATHEHDLMNEPKPHALEVPADADADFKGSLIAIRRAAARARQLAAQTGTDLILVRSGAVVRVPPPDDKTAQ